MSIKLINTTLATGLGVCLAELITGNKTLRTLILYTCISIRYLLAFVHCVYFYQAYLCLQGYLCFFVQSKWLTITNNLPSFVQAIDSNIFIVEVMTRLYYWPFLLIHHVDVKALFNIPK